ncbi:MAG: hypothetical protein ACOC1U_04935 [Spirochaetota bacterium]
MNRVANLGLMLCMLASTAAAQVTTEPREPLDVRGFERALGACPASVRRALSGDVQADATRFWRSGRWIARSVVSRGGGWYETSSTVHSLVHRPSCFFTEIREATENGSRFEAWFEMRRSEVPPPADFVDVVVPETVELFDPEDPRHDPYSLLRETRLRSGTDTNPELGWCPMGQLESSPGAVTVSDALTNGRPWRAGAPSVAPAVYSAGHLMYLQGPLRLTWSDSDLEIYELPLASHWGARAVALYDTVHDRHRWVLATTWCVVGDPVWLGRHAGWLFGVADDATLEHAPQMFAIDLRDGSVRAVALGAIVDNDGLPRTHQLCATRGRSLDDDCLRFSLHRSSITIAECDGRERECHSRRIAIRPSLDLSRGRRPGENTARRSSSRRR